MLVNDLDSSAKLDFAKSSYVLLGFVAVIALALTHILPIIKGLALYLIAVLAFGIVNIGELRRRFPVDIVVIVGSALSIAQLMISTGLSERMGAMFIELFNGWGVFGALVATYLVTLILTELVTNNCSRGIGVSHWLQYGGRLRR